MTASAPPTKSAGKLPRRRVVPRHPGLYYRPRHDGKVGPPYEFRYLDGDGNDRWEIVHGTLSEAEARRAELRLRRRRGEDIRPSRQTFADHAAEWLSRQTVKARTLEGYEWALRCHLIPYFGRRRLDQISTDEIAAFIAHLKGKGLKGWTISSALRPLSKILAHATRRGQLSVNPMSLLQRDERPTHSDQRSKRILSLHEMHALLAHTHDHQHRLLFELLLASGLRISEALGLTIGDLNHADSIINVSGQLARDSNTRAPLKTPHSQRALDIPEPLMKQLLELAEARGSLFTRDAFLFQTRTGTALQRKTIRDAFRRAALAADLTLPHPCIHDLRHGHASMLIALGVNLVAVQQRLGHADANITLKTYAHLWNYQNARQSTIGTQLAPLFAQQIETAG